MKAEKINECNSLYTKRGENQWIEKRNGKVYLIELMEGKWSCIISIEKEK
jgi:hypothetical protein